MTVRAVKRKSTQGERFSPEWASPSPNESGSSQTMNKLKIVLAPTVLLEDLPSQKDVVRFIMNRVWNEIGNKGERMSPMVVSKLDRMVCYNNGKSIQWGQTVARVNEIWGRSIVL
ncbi:hypothetical protein HPP92_004848 [Vanilla planifolia]|uniref:Uncharacterized protein n=1 Tax=Vanilla planifolia TaxID=51239 RepID=A0A835VAS5_VANPL|nr:hypothetical protein HPP92_004848 [Vanilla planifolia]